MAQILTQNLSFSYPKSEVLTLDCVNFEVKKGEFIALSGPSGGGKSTLLRHFKSVLTPHGTRKGEVFFEEKPLFSVPNREQSAKIGFVMQNPDSQIVTDKVWHELSFGGESLGWENREIRAKVAEISSFFGIEPWFHRDVDTLSGGQKQLLCLASIMVLGPSLLILDEPTSQLDPIAASEFLGAVGRINRELGVSVIITEHRLEDMLPMCDRMVVMDRGKIICDAPPREAGQALKAHGHSMFAAMPCAMRVYAAAQTQEKCPLTVREGREWLDNFAKNNALKPLTADPSPVLGKTAVELRDVWFKYEKKAPDVLRGLSLSVREGEFLALVGGNGAGKTTALSLISGLNTPYRGKVSVGNAVPGGGLGVLPQNPQALFVKKTVREDLREILDQKSLDFREKQEKIAQITQICALEGLLERHPYDLSGGEMQRAALAKVLLLEPRVLLLDEPTKGLDAEFKRHFAAILKRLTASGVTIIMVSHDIEFCAKYASRCAMLFDGGLVGEGTPREFFPANSFYTTSASRMARHLLPLAVTAEDIIFACGSAVPPEPKPPSGGEAAPSDPCRSLDCADNKKAATPPARAKLPKRTMAAAIMILLLIPFTIYFGVFHLNDRKYYLISLLVMLETMLPFFLIFEGRKPQARELVIISVLCAIGVAGRGAFFMLPQFKPVAAMTIIAGVAFGGEAGFMVGAVTMLASNFMFGQGPFTPWQMFAMGLIGFFAGVLFRKGWLKRSRLPLCVFGGISTIVIYGGIINPSFIIMSGAEITAPALLAAYAAGLPMDLVHAAATVFFLWIAALPMLEKLGRIKVKYGLVERQ